MRITIEDTIMNIALEWSKRSTCSSRVSVGAVLVNKHNRIVAAGYNGAPSGMTHCDEVGCELVNGNCISSIHAEENAIIQCAREGISTDGLVMYTTHSPCARCARRIIQAGISSVWYAYPYKDLAETEALFEKAGILINEWMPSCLH